MKRFIATLIILGIMSSVFGVFLIERTITIDAPTLAAIRTSPDPIINTLSDPNNIVNQDNDNLRAARPTPPAINILNAAVLTSGQLYDALFTETDNDDYIKDILDELLRISDPDSTNAAFAYFLDQSVGAKGRALDLTYYTINAAMLYDCLYHLPSNEFQNHDLDAIKSQLKEILSRSIELTVDTIASYETLSTNQKYWGEAYLKTMNIPLYLLSSIDSKY